MNLLKPVSTYKIFLFFFAFIFVVQLSPSFAAATEDIPKEFDAYWNGAPDAYMKFKSCLPFASEETFKAQILRIPENSYAKITNSNKTNSTNYILAQGDVFICMHLDSKNKPIIPTNFFLDTIYFSAQSDEDRAKLHLDLSRQLNKYGFAHALIVMKNGNATHIAYMINDALPDRVYYNVFTLKHDEFEINDFKSVYHIPDSPLTISTYGNNTNSKPLLQGVLAPRPLKDDFFVINGTKKTGEFAFTGTKWTSKGQPNIVFENDGKLIFYSTTGAPMQGNWKIENDVLHFHYGFVYVSAVLNEQGDALIAEGRTLFPRGFALEGNKIMEMRWKSSWARSMP